MIMNNAGWETDPILVLYVICTTKCPTPWSLLRSG